MTLKYPAGSGIVSLPAQPEPKKPIQKRKRRPTVPGGNSQYAVSCPDKTSPLHAFVVLCRAYEWNAEIIKFPCWCEVWDNRAANAVVIWKGTVHHSWCVCEVKKMSHEEMLEAIA